VPRAAELLDALDLEAVGAQAGNLRAHLVEQRAEILHVRFSRRR
jgi:hypothetical protein